MVHVTEAARSQVLREGVEAFREHRAFFIGLAVLIGSVGLLLGALTTAVSAVMMEWFGFELVPAMVIGFAAVGVISFIAGLTLVAAGATRLAARTHGTS